MGGKLVLFSTSFQANRWSESSKEYSHLYIIIMRNVSLGSLISLQQYSNVVSCTSHPLLGIPTSGYCLPPVPSVLSVCWSSVRSNTGMHFVEHDFLHPPLVYLYVQILLYYSVCLFCRTWFPVFEEILRFLCAWAFLWVCGLARQYLKRLNDQPYHMTSMCWRWNCIVHIHSMS